MGRCQCWRPGVAGDQGLGRQWSLVDWVLKYAEMHGKFSFNDMSKIRESALAEIHPLVTDSPFSGDPSYCIESSMGNSMSVSVEQLALFSTNQSVIDEVAALSKAIGYVVVD